MIILDTDHLSTFRYEEHPRSIRLKEALTAAAVRGEQLATTITTAEEMMRGWLAKIHRERDFRRHVALYR